MHGAVEGIYEFTRELDLIRASFSQQYWTLHRALEEQGRLDHARDRCPVRDGPRAIAMWHPEAGWRTIAPRR